jgi:MinD-like ATPase involved in chromosome partitioning or flagellar assembly
MITDDEKVLNWEVFYNNLGSRVKPQRNSNGIHTFLNTYQQTEDSVMHTQLNLDLIEYHWQKKIPPLFI